MTTAVRRKPSRHPKGPLVDAEHARRHIRNLMAAGVSLARIAQAADIGVATVSGLLYTRGQGRPRCEQIRLENARRIVRVRAEQVVTGSVDAAGTRRRLQALMANGWPQLRLGPHFELHPHYVTELLRQPRVFGTTAMAVAAAYERLWNQDPRHHGVGESAYKKVRTHARANSWAPPGAWDDDTIDDPTAHPEWTGHCGTDHGWWMHKANDIPTCPRCDEAHAAWIAERKHLPAPERVRQLCYAKGAASQRGATLAADARELMRITGQDVERIATRLGVTKAHLYQELLRHPEPEPAVDAELAA
ncbi:hypothetical protein ACIP8U_00625 [Streptomyces pseudovenezuelae]|uniref:hypothetical protein n=1 Tax=Streptomyces pseudovenezuelae TaxID=67350 RepID=UPI0038202F28